MTPAVFRLLLGCHIAAGLTAVIAGALAMRTPKSSCRHPRAGSLYYRALVLVTATAAGLAVFRWPMDLHLLVLAAMALAFGTLGYVARRVFGRAWPAVHVIGLGSSYITMLTAFYVDNGPHLPIWQRLPPITFWTLPTLIGAVPLIRALRRHLH